MSFIRTNTHRARMCGVARECRAERWKRSGVAGAKYQSNLDPFYLINFREFYDTSSKERVRERVKKQNTTVQLC